MMYPPCASPLQGYLRYQEVGETQTSRLEKWVWIWRINDHSHCEQGKTSFTLQPTSRLITPEGLIDPYSHLQPYNICPIFIWRCSAVLWPPSYQYCTRRREGGHESPDHPEWGKRAPQSVHNSIWPRLQLCSRRRVLNLSSHVPMLHEERACSLGCAAAAAGDDWSVNAFPSEETEKRSADDR